MNIRAVGAELFHADRRTDMTKLVATFRNFTKALKEATVEISLLGTTELSTYCPDTNITA